MVRHNLEFRLDADSPFISTYNHPERPTFLMLHGYDHEGNTWRVDVLPEHLDALRDAVRKLEAMTVDDREAIDAMEADALPEIDAAEAR